MMAMDLKYAPPTASSNVVVQQPTVTTVQNTTVIVNQQPMGWSSGLCSCFDDIGSCCCVCFCGNVYYASIAVRMNESACVGLSGYPSGCVPGGHLAMRASFRNKHGIPGDICSDCMTNAFCLPCAMCQLSREMDARGYTKNGCC